MSKGIFPQKQVGMSHWHVFKPRLSVCYRRGLEQPNPVRRTMNIDKKPVCVSYVAELYVRPLKGGPPALRGPVIVHREIPAHMLEA